MSFSSSSDEKLLYISNMEYQNDWSGNFTPEQTHMANSLSRFAVMPFSLIQPKSAQNTSMVVELLAQNAWYADGPFIHIMNDPEVL